MWYSSIKVGITEIDMDHSNVDTMLQLYFADRIPKSYLKQIIASLINHFDHEEEIIVRLGHEFPAEHKLEHARLTKQLEEMLADWEADRLDGKEFAEAVRALLLLHVVEFDVPLGKTSS
ncbi:MAG: hypothetical protein KAG12_08710 [Desulfuromusa sp.]|nr:hypothetical protein [Desulfuromusa sp.]